MPINAHGQVEWTPPPELNTGQTSVDDYRHPERMLNHGDGEPDDGLVGLRYPASPLATASLTGSEVTSSITVWMNRILSRTLVGNTNG